jgi:xanthine dehydrogenase accessory factor
MNDELLRLLADNAAAGTPCVLATVVRTEPPTSAHPGDKAVITADGRLHGWIGGSCSEPLVRREALRAMADGMPRMVRIVPSADVAETREGGEVTVATTCPSGGALDILVDPQTPRPLLVVVGGSPAARVLVQLSAAMGFRVVAVHPGAQPADFPGAAQVLASLDRAAFDAVGAADADTWVVVATMGHYDDEALAAVLAALPWADVALVASQRRAAAALSALRSRGVLESDVARVRSPAGEHRGGTQEEIALHALDEVVTLRRARLVAAFPAVAAEPAGFAVDPVCGMTVDVAESQHPVDQGGAAYHFCCAACAASFAADPDRYLRAARA